MNAFDLNASMQYIDDQYLDIADAPQKEIMEMSKYQRKKSAIRILLIAAMIAMLSITAYAADFLHIKTLVSSTGKRYGSYQEMGQAIKKAGFQMDVIEKFDSGYTFDKAYVSDVDALDEDGRKVLTYQEIEVDYRNEEGEKLILFAYSDQEALPHKEHVLSQAKEISDIMAHYHVDHYKFVPDDYQLTEAEELWRQQPGNFISFGSEEVKESAVSFLCWTKDGICYSMMDPDATESADTLFTMAEELMNHCEEGNPWFARSPLPD